MPPHTHALTQQSFSEILQPKFIWYISIFIFRKVFWLSHHGTLFFVTSFHAILAYVSWLLSNHYIFYSFKANDTNYVKFQIYLLFLQMFMIGSFRRERGLVSYNCSLHRLSVLFGMYVYTSNPSLSWKFFSKWIGRKEWFLW